MPDDSKTDEVLIEVEGLRKWFTLKSGMLTTVKSHVRAVDGVDLQVKRGETLGIVGESGCGKTTLGRVILGLTHMTEGSVHYAGEDIRMMTNRDLRRRLQIVFQDPGGSMNPRMSGRSIVGEPLQVNGMAEGAELTQRVADLLDSVGLKREHMNRFPHEFSGGQRQRIGIARALALNPEFIICDEPIAALDVSIQAQVVNLLEDLQEKLGLTYLFISHDLSMIRHMAKRVAVMYLGHIVEIASSQELYTNPQHPYTRALLSAVPSHDPVREESRERIILTGDVPSPANPPSGCPFRTRCFMAEARCADSRPEAKALSVNHSVSCHLI